MGEIILNNIYLAILLPMWIFLIIMLGRFFSVYVNKNIIYILTLLSSLFGAIITGFGIFKINPNTILESKIVFVKIQDFIINCGFHIDKTALIFAFVLFAVSFFVQLFSVHYMKNEHKTYRFYAILNLFNAVMSALFFSPNLFQVYILWEIAGVISYLLIGFDYKSLKKSIASQKVFIINRIGDTAFLGAIILSCYYIYEYSGNLNLTTLSFVDFNAISTFLFAYTSNTMFWLICILFITSALVKSAQLPFHTWLQDAMEAKLPVSALLHSATLVALGIFLLVRIMPLLTFIPLILKTVVIIGFLTAVLCSLFACAEKNNKKILAYSTSAQLGLIYTTLGYCNLKATFVLFIAHAITKALMFLTLPDENENWNLFNKSIFIISALSLSGLILSGFIGKDILCGTTWNNLEIMSIILSLLTGYYITVLVFRNWRCKFEQQSSFLQKISILGLMFANVFFFIYLITKITPIFTWSTLSAFLGICFALILLIRFKNILDIALLRNAFYLDIFYTKILSKIFEAFCNMLLSVEKNVFSNYNILINIARFKVKAVNFIEIYVMNGVVNFVTSFSKKISICDMKLQTSNVQRYNAYALIIITCTIACLVLAYTAIISLMGGV